jgi:TPR repeat protein
MNNSPRLFLFLMTILICGCNSRTENQGGNKLTAGGGERNQRPSETESAKNEITPEQLSKITRQAREGDIAAMLELGRRILNGEGVPAEPSKAVHWFSLAAEKGDPYAANQLGACYDDGLGVAKNDKKAFEWYLRSIEFSSEMLREHGDPAPLPLRAMHAIALFNVGTCLHLGEGVAKDDRAAVEYLKKAAPDFGPAQSLLQEMAANGFQPASEALARLNLQNGSDAGENTATEIKKAALKGAPEAQCQMGVIYLQGIGVDRDDQKGFEWMKKAALSGFGPAQLNLAKLYEQGRGVGRNSSESVQMLEKALGNNQPEAGYLLGLRYYYGHGVDQSLEEAKINWQKAARLGDVSSKEALEKASEIKNIENWSPKYYLEPNSVLLPSVRPEPPIPRGIYIKAFVNSPDGYSNLRGGPSIKSKVIEKIYKGEEVFVMTSGEGEWWPCVFLPLNRTGYIHSSGVGLERQGPDFEVIPN